MKTSPSDTSTTPPSSPESHKEQESDDSITPSPFDLLGAEVNKRYQVPDRGTYKDTGGTMNDGMLKVNFSSVARVRKLFIRGLCSQADMKEMDKKPDRQYFRPRK